MRRTILACTFFLLLLAAFCHKQLLGLLLKTAAKSQASVLAYRDLRFQNGSLILKDVILFDIKGEKSAYLLHADELSLSANWNWPFSFSVYAEKPHLLISPKYFKDSSLDTVKSQIQWSIQVDEGTLEWMDSPLPPSQFSLLAGSDERLEIGLTWGGGVMEIERKGKCCHAEWSRLPFHLLLTASQWSGFSFPVSDDQGTISGQADLNLEEKRVSFTAIGDALSFQWKKAHFTGSLLFEGLWENKTLKKMQVHLTEGHIESSPVEIQEIESHLSYQAGLGVKVFGQAVASRESFGSIPGVIQESAVGQGCGNMQKVRGTFCIAEQVSEQRTGPEGSTDFLAGGGVPEDASSLGCRMRDIARGKDRSEDKKYVAKATRHNRFLGHERYNVEWEGKSFIHDDQLEWAEGKATFGNALGSLRWNENGGWTLNWEKIGVEEISLLQGLAAKFFPSAADWRWHSGTVQAEVTFEEGLKAPSLTLVHVDDLDLEANGVHFQAKSAAYDLGDWKLDEFHLRHEDITLEGNGKWHSEREGTTVTLVGEIAGIRFAGIAENEEERFTLSIPRFEGDLPPCLWPGSQGKIEAVGNGFEIRGSAAGIEDWGLSCQIKEGSTTFTHTLNFALSNIALTLQANPTSIDVLAAKGSLSVPIGEHVLNTSFFVPRMQWKQGSSLFDLRLRDGATDLLRLKGTKELEQVELDPSSSHFLGQSIVLKKGVWEKGMFSLLDVAAEIDCPLFESYLRRLGLDLWSGFPKLERVHFAGHLIGEKMGFSLTTPRFYLKEDLPLRGNFNTEKMGNQWLSQFAIGPTTGQCALEYKEGALRINEGKVSGPMVSFDFSGSVNRKLEGAFILKKMWADLNYIPPIQLGGNVEGQAEVSFTKEELQSDLDLVLKEASYDGYLFENTGPLHLSYSSRQGTRIKGIDCRIQKEQLEAHAKMDLLKFDKMQNRWNIQKAKTHIPSDFLPNTFLNKGGYIDCLADASFSADFSEWACTVKEALLPLGDSIRHIKDMRAFGKGDSFFSDALVHHKAKWAKLSLQMTRSNPLRGRLFLEEPEKAENPLSIDWSYEKERGLSIISMEGAFAGLDASFHAYDTGQLIGSSKIDFQRLSEWLPPDVSKGFEELKLGKGYELKGNLQIDPQNLSHVTFQGIFSGKQIELAGFQFRTLLSRADLSPDFYRIYDLKISDSAGLLKIDDISIKQEEDQPWTIAIPKIAIEELRPSLLVKPGEEPGPVSPLVLRQFKMVDFHGLLAEGKSWQATGELSFINSFKREETVFDLPANVLGRIVGLDLDLLIPVQGELNFDLRDGYFNLGQLRGAYSEGKRSEFFLVETESDRPRMDLDGNLQILVKMKQFVLFSLTEAFLISIDGKLNDPHFSLQRKKRFL